MQYTEEELALLEEAKRKYPEGTVINSLGGCRNFKCAGHDFHFRYNRNTHNITAYGVTLYSGGKWAEIINTEDTNQVINNYSFY